MTMPITFITGNQGKADYLAKYLGHQVAHRKVDLDELQSLSLQTIVDHKVRQAYEIVQQPVLVEDVSLKFSALGSLPGPFIKFFIEEIPFETLCRMLDGLDRAATARCMFGYFDGTDPVFFSGQLQGSIAQHPSGDNGYGWDKIFIPQGYNLTRADMDEAQYKETYLRIKPVAQLRSFLETRRTD